MSHSKRLLAGTALGALLAISASGTAQAIPSYDYANITFTAFTLSGVVDVNGNALTGVTGLVAAVNSSSSLAKLFGFVALIMASVNIFGGFLVTQRMLAMYKKKEKK